MLATGCPTKTKIHNGKPGQTTITYDTGQHGHANTKSVPKGADARKLQLSKFHIPYGQLLCDIIVLH